MGERPSRPTERWIEGPDASSWLQTEEIQAQTDSSASSGGTSARLVSALHTGHAYLQLSALKHRFDKNAERDDK